MIERLGSTFAKLVGCCYLLWMLLLVFYILLLIVFCDWFVLKLARGPGCMISALNVLG